MKTAFILIGVNAVIMVALFLYVRRRLNTELSSRRLVDEAYSEVNQMIVELNQTTERNIALIEERISALSAILTTADKRIAMLSDRAQRQDKPRPKKTAVPDRSAGYLDLGRPGVQRQPAQDAKQRETADVEGRPDSVRVVQLYEQGIEPKLIASRLGTTIGEVELIISLKTGNR